MIGSDKAVCKGMAALEDRGVTFVMHESCYCCGFKACKEVMAANLQRPASGNWYKERSHKLWRQQGQRAPPETCGQSRWTLL